jgi:GTP-binding protein EngB required for normal cell division
MNKSTQIKNIVAKIDTDKMASYLQVPRSKTLKRIINYSKRVQGNNEEKEIFRLAARIAYDLDTIVNKTDYVKNEEEKKHWLEISHKLFENTIGVKEKD